MSQQVRIPRVQESAWPQLTLGRRELSGVVGRAPVAAELRRDRDPAGANA